MKTKIKICGLMCAEDAKLLHGEDVAYGGIVMFCPNSRRNRLPEQAAQILAAFPRGIRSVAVTVSPSAQEAEWIERLGFDMIQIHGQLLPETLEAVQLPILRAVNLSGLREAPEAERESESESEPKSGATRLDNCFAEDCEKIAGYVLDAQVPGSGRTFDWSVLKELPPIGKPVLIAGGLSPENVASLVAGYRPYGVDVSSGVERSGGTGKDGEKLLRFIEAVRAAEAGR